MNCARYEATCTSLNFFGTVNVCAAEPCPTSPTCRGNQAESCSWGSLLLWDCSRSGTKCQVNPDGGNASCVTDGKKTCDPMVGRRCEGSVVIACDGIGFAARTDCALNPTRRRCLEGECVDTGTECTNVPSSCDGTFVKFCQDGFTRKIDCIGAGFGGCDAGGCTRM